MQSAMSMRMRKVTHVAKPTGLKAVLPRLVARAQAEESKSGFAKFAAGVGMPTDDGVFGFTPFAEQWVGRWAMIGFAASIIGEFKTGQGALGQIGLSTPSTPLLVAICVLALGGSVVGTVLTGKKMVEKKMSKTEVARYKNFLRLNEDEDERRDAARAMKGLAPMAAESTSMDSSTVDPEAAAAAEAAAEADKKAAAKKVAIQEMYPGEANDLAYARDVELTNGRWAMIGFLASIMVEASNGSGILGQTIVYLKLSGMLGDKSGF